MSSDPTAPRVLAVCASGTHQFSKAPQTAIQLIAGIGVAGDAHAGATVKHRSRVRRDPTQPNLRQVHLIHAELFAELRALGFALGPGDIGENITTAGIELLALPRGTRLHLGTAAVLALTGLRNPCVQLDRFQPGLMQEVLTPQNRCGVMAIVLTGGWVYPGDALEVEIPAGSVEPLDVV